MPQKPLSGIRVVAFSWYVTAPQITKTLAAYGAEVIRVEGRTRHDPQRTTRPFKDEISGVNRSGDFNQYNTGKLSIALNLGHTKGVELAKRLIARSDIVVENFAGGVIDRMGLGYEQLKKVKPDIIMLSTCMQGQSGPYANHPGTGYQLTALSGFYQITGWPSLEPTAPDGPYPDYIAPRFGALLVLASLEYRRRTGRGQYIDMSQYETAIHFLAPLILDDAVNQRVAGRMGNRCLHAAPHGAYRCRDKETGCSITISTDEEWQSFRRVIGSPAWAEDARLSTLPARKKNEAELDRLVEEWTTNYPSGEVALMMREVGVPAEVLSCSENLLKLDSDLKRCYSSAVPNAVYRCLPEERWCAISVCTDEEWRSFRRVIESPTWTGESRFSTLLARKENEDELDRLVEQWTTNHSTEEVMTLMQAAGISAGVVETGEDMMERDPQLKHRHLFWELDHPEIGKYRAAGPSFKLSKAPAELQRAPLLGEHNEYVLKQILGLSDEEVADLVIEGVVE